MPDIDIDFDAAKRQDVIDYVISKYGEKKVVGIITFNTLGAKQVIRDVGRVLNIKQSLIDILAKACNKDLKTAFELKEVYGNEIFVKFRNSLIKNIIDEFRELFININFCYKYKENNNYQTKCILCKLELKSEGDYHKHIKGEQHKQFLKEYENNPSRELFEMHDHSIKDFLDVIRQNYKISSNESILKLINDLISVTKEEAKETNLMSLEYVVAEPSKKSSL